jgi:hypothetical protein
MGPYLKNWASQLRRTAGKGIHRPTGTGIGLLNKAPEICTNASDAALLHSPKSSFLDALIRYGFGWTIT